MILGKYEKQIFFDVYFVFISLKIFFFFINTFFQQVTPGADRENTTVIAACSAAGEYLPPMIVFMGKFVQTTWKPNYRHNYNNYHWLHPNPSGWMDSDIFFKWFDKWEVKTRVFKVAYISNSLKIYAIA